MKNKPGIPFWSKFNLATKILAVFLTLSVISLGVVGAFTAVNLRELGKYALDRQESLGRSAIQDSSAAMNLPLFSVRKGNCSPAWRGDNAALILTE